MQNVQKETPKAQRLRRRHNHRFLKRRDLLFPYDRLSYRVFFRLFVHGNLGTHTPPSNVNERVIVFSPHQDDETLGCGGFIIGCRNSAEVQPVIVTNGRGPTWARTEAKRLRLAEIRTSEVEKVCKALGTTDPINLGFEGAEIQQDNPAVTEEMSKIIERFRPTLILAPFFSDASKEHLWTTRNLAKVKFTNSENVKVLLYRVHGQIPRGFQNAFFGLSDEVHSEKEKVLSLYESQHLDRDVVREKYLLYSTLMPSSLKSQYKSVERFCSLSFEEFSMIDRKYGNDRYLNKIRSINYAPYSFRCFALNHLQFQLSPLAKKGVSLLKKTDK